MRLFALPASASRLPWLLLNPQEDFMKAVRKLGEAKKLEGQISYSAEFKS
jgi:hypothetical protein